MRISDWSSDVCASDLLVAHGIGAQLRRRLHCDKGEQLQHVVLDHVAQRAVVGVIAFAAVDAGGFGDQDVDRLDPAVLPHRFHQRVAEAQREQVLYRCLAQVMVRSEEHTSELQSLMRNSYAVFCLTKKTYINTK